jgi:hypothetical protein
MCCLVTALVLIGPRATIVVWWLVSMDRWKSAFDSFLVPFLGFLIAPWTTLMYVLVAPTGEVVGIDWFWLGVAALVDLTSYSGGAYGNRERISEYYGRGGGYPPAAAG